MFKLFLLISTLCAFASAGYLGGLAGHGYGLGYSAYAAPALHSSISYSAPAVVAAAPTIVKSYAAPAVVAAPIVKSYAAPALVSAPIIKTAYAAAPLATSYANTYKIATKSFPVVQAAPAIAYHSAPAVIAAAPAYHATSSYHGLGALGLGHGIYGHSVYH